MANLCANCHESLLTQIEADSDVEDSKTSANELESVPDDVELSCGCHYHWYVMNELLQSLADHRPGNVSSKHTP